MNGYVARKGDRWYAVVYEGLDPSPVGSVEAGMPAASTVAMPRG